MVLNFTLVDRKDATPGETFSRGRTWYGWDATASPETLWEANRGDWSLAPRSTEQRYATFSYRGEVVLVAAITGREPMDEAAGTWALTGHVLDPEHPAAAALLGHQMPRRRNPVAYVEDLPHIDDIPVQALATPEPTAPEPRPAVIATWSPATGGGFDGPLSFDDIVAATAAGNLVHDRWSVGQRKHGIEVGDRLYLLRLGDEAGIVASGWVTSTPFTASHWDPSRAASGDTAQYVYLDWDYVIPVEDRLTREDLRALLPGAVNNWGPMGGGVPLAPNAAATLADAWADHVGDRGAKATLRGGSGPAGGGQGRQMDAVRRKKIEDAAQARLEEHYRALGYVVEDVRFKEHYDARATRGDEVIYLEAKGTTTNGASVIVTRGEVAWARTHPGQVIMGLWSGMGFGADEEVDPAAGTFSVFPFDPDAGRLEPRDYDWFPG